MAPISTKLHGVGDIAGTAAALGAPRILPIRDRRAQAITIATGGVMLVNSALTDYEFGLRRKLSMSTHLLVDAIGGGLLLAGALSLQRAKGTRTADWLPLAGLGAGQILGAALTERRPRGHIAGAPAPIETPGPSVSSPRAPRSDAVPQERLDDVMSDPGSLQTGETLVAQEEAAAAAEAAAIGGAVTAESPDPALDPVYQAGGGEQDGWEAAEAELIENASHGDGRADPRGDAIS